MDETLSVIEDGFFMIAGVVILAFCIRAGYRLIKALANKTRHLNPIVRIVLLSFVLTAIFGIGLCRSGGNPGFGFPAPVILAALFTNPSSIVFDAVIPFFVWWGFFFIFLLVKSGTSKLRTWKV